MNPLDRVVAHETMQEVLDCLTGRELLLVLLRLDGWTWQQIGDHLGVTRKAVNWHMTQARRRIIAELPDLDVNGHNPQRGVSHRRNGNGDEDGGKG